MLSFFGYGGQSEKPTSTKNENSIKTTQAFIFQEGGSGHKEAAGQLMKVCDKDEVKYTCINTTLANWLSFKTYAEMFGPTWMQSVPSFLKHVSNSPEIHKLSPDYNWGLDGTNKWNTAQKEGDIATQNNLVSQQNLAERFFSHSFKTNTTKLLNEFPDLEQITSTQQLCIASMLEAVSNWNREHNKNVIFKVVMTDLATEAAKHFGEAFASINLTHLNNVKLILDIPRPALPINLASNADYHAALALLYPFFYIQGTNCPQPNIIINFTDGPVNKRFKEISDEFITTKEEEVLKKYQSKPIFIQANAASYEQLKLHPLLQPYLTEIGAESDIKHFALTLPTHIPIAVESVLLGSKPSEKGTKMVVELIQEFRKRLELEDEEERKAKRKIFVFVYCGNDNLELLNNIYTLATDRMFQMDGRFIIVPLSRQDQEKTIAHIDCISDGTDRIGGMRSMEKKILLKNKKHGVMAIFAEKSEASTKEEMIANPEKTLVSWEAGNSKDMQIELGARVAVLNKYTYVEGRLAMHRAQKKNYARKLRCKDPKLSFEMTDGAKELRYYDIGFAYYKAYKKDEKNNNAKLYGILYEKACEGFHSKILDKKAVSPYLALLHPIAWALKVADYFFEKVKIQDVAIEQQTNVIYRFFSFATIYANSFYNSKLNIVKTEQAYAFTAKCEELHQKNLSLSMDLIYQIAIQNWLATESEAFDNINLPKSTSLTARTALAQQTVHTFIHSNETILLQCEELWKKDYPNINVKISALFELYSPQLESYNPACVLSFLGKNILHPGRTKQKEAAEIIQYLKENPFMSAKDIIDYLNKFMAELKKELGDKLNEKGAFMIISNFALKKLTEMEKANCNNVTIESRKAKI